MADCRFFGDDGDGGAGAGGAIYITASNLTAAGCSFDENVAYGDGGALYINAADDNCIVEMSNCTFAYNYTDYDFDGYGGAIYMVSYAVAPVTTASLELTSCTFFQNEAEGLGLGGGLAQEGVNSTTTIRNCIFDNWADDYDNTVRLNSAGEVADVGTINSYNSLYSDTPDLTDSNYDITGQDSWCYDMADNGGLTPTCAIDSISPARDAGSTVLATDQRGVTRGSPSDIGAYQWVGPTYADDSKANDNGNGLSWATAKKHVYAAANLAGPGSATYVAAGTYLGEYHWDVYDLDYYNINITKPLILAGAGAASTIIDDSAPHVDYDDTIMDVYGGYYYDSDEDEDVYGPISISGFTLKNAQGEDCYGGGLYIESEGVTTVSDCIIEDNYAEDGGGGIYAYGGDNVTISGCTVNGNESSGYGGGIYFDDCDIFSLTDSNVNGNSSSYDGGGIYGDEIYGDEYGDYTLISRCTIDSNTADGSGGGIYLYDIDYSEYPVTIEACTLSNNEAAGSGGGLYNYEDSSVLLTNCTIYGNSLPDGGYGGGGIYNIGEAELLNCTIASNDAGPGGEGGGYGEYGDGTFENTIVANNTADGSDNDMYGAAITSDGHNICTTDGSRDYFNGAGDQVNTDPGLGPLQSNGGPTWTCAIGAISPAYNGTEETTSWVDQRGVERPQNTYWDVGAYEYVGDPPSGPTTVKVETLANGSGTVVGSQNLAIGSTLTVYSITRDSGGAFVANAAATWSFAGKTGGVADTDLVAAGDNKSAVMTGHMVGTGVIHAAISGLTSTDSGIITVTAAPAPTAPTITSVSPNSGMWGETLAITVTGTNFTGATSVSFGPGITVTFTVVSPTQINATITTVVGAAPGARNVTVTTPQGSATGSFTVNANPSLINGTQSHGGGGGSGGSGGSGQGNQGMSPVSMPNIVVQSATLSAAKVAPGEAVTITANLANKGTVNGTSAVKVYVNGQEEAIQGVTVNSGSNRPVSFTLSRNEPGTYTVYVGGTPAGSFTVEQTVDPNVILLISAALFLSGLVLGVIYIRRRQSYY